MSEQFKNIEKKIKPTKTASAESLLQEFSKVTRTTLEETKTIDNANMICVKFVSEYNNHRGDREACTSVDYTLTVTILSYDPACFKYIAIVEKRSVVTFLQPRQGKLNVVDVVSFDCENIFFARNISP